MPAVRPAQQKRSALFTGLRRLYPDVVTNVRENHHAISDAQWKMLEDGHADAGLDEEKLGALLGYLTKTYWKDLGALLPRR